MYKVLSKSALSLALAGGLLLSGGPTATVDGPVNAEVNTNFSVMSPTQASPELAEFAKKHGIDLSKHSAMNKVLQSRGEKFQQAGNNRVTYQETGSEVPMLVLLVEFADGTAPKGAPEERVPAKYFDDLIFGDEYNPYELEQFAQYGGSDVPKDRTMQNIYSENSYGNVELTTNKNIADVGWVTLPKTADHYLGQDNGDAYNVNGYAHMGELVTDLIQTADPKIDFSEYAVETEDGQVLPNVFIVHAGTGAEWSRDPAQIWSHKWDVPSAMFYGEYYQTGSYSFADTDDNGSVSLEEEQAWMDANKHKWTTEEGVKIGNYGIQPELGGNIAGYNAATGSYDKSLSSGPYPAQPGVFSHEFGHVLGLPDFYDTDYSSEGVGDFSMMAGGSWLSSDSSSSAYSGNTPSGFDPFSKIFLGWADPIEVKPGEEKTITLKPVNEAKSDQAFVKMEVPGSNGTEYFLFENIQQVGFNAGYQELGKDAHGLAAWHVDENVISLYQKGYARANNVENWMNKRFQSNQTEIAADGTEVSHYGLSLLQADGEYDLEKYENRGDAKDFFQTGDEITPTSSNVHTGSYYFWQEQNNVPANSGIYVTDIVENEDGTVTANFSYGK